MSPTKESQHAIAVPSSSHKKSSVLMGLPSLLKGSSSRRSLHSDKEKSDAKSAKEEARHAREAEKERHKKEDKERSESRISVLMGRKRGKVRIPQTALSHENVVKTYVVQTDAVIRSAKEARACRYAPHADYRSPSGHSPTFGQLEVWLAVLSVFSR